MAEGLLGGVPRDEDERPDVESSDARAGAEAFAATVAARLSASDSEVARETSAFLKEQTELLRVQKEHLKDEHAARLHLLQGQAREVDIRRFGLRLRVGVQLFIALVATVIGIGGAIVIHDAINSRSVVVEVFEISPGLAAQALNGHIVAAGLHDRLTQLQAATRTSVQKREISSAWTNDIAIDVPETGVSISQIDRILRTRFGHDQHISGSLVKADPAGLALTVRGAGVLPRTFSDGKGDLEALLTRAAEYVYGEAQPGLFSHYLANDVARYDDAIAFAKAHLATASVDDRALLLNYWANSIAGLAGANAGAEALVLHREAVRIKPDYWTGYGNVANDLSLLGDEEGAILVLLKMMKNAGGRPGKAPESEYGGYDAAVYALQVERAAALSDLAATGGISNVGYAEPELSIAQLDVQLHEVDTARLRLKTAIWDPKSHTSMAGFLFTQALLAEEVGDLVTAAKMWDDYAAQYADRLVNTNSPSSMCWAAPTYEKTGQGAKADAALAAPLKAVGISTYLDCYRFKGDVLDLRGDWAEAQQWYAKAVKLNPSSPAGHYSWALALLRHGDLAGSTEQLRLANQKGPSWADPLKVWGDLLVKQGNNKDALAKYDEALKFAPDWNALKDARADIAKQKS
jgi:tetratricopeptide (TPR) repeat protein